MRNKSLCITTSCRELAHLSMCKSEKSSASKLLTWNEQCASGDCKLCPNLVLSLPEPLHNLDIEYAQWVSKKVKVDTVDKTDKINKVDKYIFDLYQVKTTLKNAVEKLNEMMTPLRMHIYTAHRQWNAHDHARLALDSTTLITVEDYQMNLKLLLSENPTSKAYRTNKRSVAMYGPTTWNTCLSRVLTNKHFWAPMCHISAS